jgi:hypothetical protein
MSTDGKLQLVIGLLFWYCIFMSTSRENAIPKKKGRPATGRDPTMSLRMPLHLRSEVEKWAASQGDNLTVSKAICRLVELGLTVTVPKIGKTSSVRKMSMGDNSDLANAPKRSRPKSAPPKKPRPRRP